MRSRPFILLGVFSLVLFVAVACAGRSTPPPDPINGEQTAIAQTVEAERAIAQAVAATLTAGAVPADATQAPTATAAAPNADATVAPATNTSSPPTATPPPPTNTPTPERLVITESDTDGDDGNDFIRGSSQSNGGRVVLLPGFPPEAVTDTPVFNGRMALRVEVFDTRRGQNDGDGIQTVTFTIVDNFTGEPVYSNVEEQHPFCLFGGNDPLCTTFVFAQNGLRWPNGEPMFNDGYTVNIDILALNGDETQWRWLFQLAGAADRPVNGGGTAGSNFSGSWYTNFAEVALQQNGTEVIGSYARYGFNEQIPLQGEVSGQTLSGFFGNNSADRFTFTLSSDGNTFDGSWLFRTDGRERQWCGIRVGLGALPDGCGFSGDWLTISDYEPASQPTARLQQVGPNVSGTFFNGSGSGTIIGNLGEAGDVRHHALSGIYTIGGNSGPMRWDLLDFNSDQFSGCWVNQEGAHEWCGWRPGGSQPAQCFPTEGCP